MEDLVIKNVIEGRIKELGITIPFLANKVGMDYTALWKSVNGKRTFKPNELKSIADALRISVDLLLGGDDNEILSYKNNPAPQLVETTDAVTKAIVILRSVIKDRDKLPPEDKEILRGIMEQGARYLENNPAAVELTSSDS